MSGREEAVFGVNAQIYVLDTDTQNWAPATQSIVPVAFYYDPATGRTRIIGMEDNEAKVNSMILPGMSFMKPSETFGQWLDLTSNQLFGLNFTSVTDTDNFALTFQQAVDGKRPGPEPPKPAPGPSAPKPTQAASVSASAASAPAPNKFAKPTANANAISPTTATANGADDSKQVAELTKKLQQKEAELQLRQQEIESLSVMAQSFESLQAQTKAIQNENEQLKAQVRSLTEQASKASQNSGLEQQLKSARDDVARLKAALLQNSTNANLWKEQLTKVEEENKSLIEKVKKLEEIQKTLASVLSK